MNKISGFAKYLLFGFIIFISHTGNAAQKQAKADVRLLIDISGRMKKNDPNNLRVPALQLVTNLMPAGADAGVWAFGRYVNMMVPLATVDENWQKKATLTANKINSAGLYTNIGGVLQKASYGWSTPDASEKRSLILLTDGMVDISKDPAVNKKEREKILNEILPKLVNAKVAIHTVALSKNADHELLKTLSNQTDGWYQAVDSAEKLQKVFLKIFEQSAQRDTLPLDNNRFNVDASIEEMTLLVFKEGPLDTTKLKTPSGVDISEASKDGKVRWFATAGYDLVTIDKPEVGEWQIDAKVDPDNRVMVVSNLSLDVAEVPNNLLAGEAINYSVSLMEEGEKIVKPDFLKLVEAKLIQDKAGQKNRLAMFFDGGENSFKQNFFTDDFEGVLNLTLDLRSPTFERTRNHAINVYGSPLTHEITASTQEETPHLVKFKVREDIVDATSLKTNLTINHPDGEKQFLGMESFDEPLEIKVHPAGGKYEISLDIKGRSIVGRDFSVSPEPIMFESLPTEAFLAQNKVKEDPIVEEQKPVDVTKDDEKQDKVDEEKTDEVKKEEEKPKAEETVEDTKAVEEAVDWTFWVYIGIGLNVLLGGLGFLGWKLIKKKNHQSSALMADQLGIEDDDDDEDEASDKERGE